jgi:hypothetical protein
MEGAAEYIGLAQHISSSLCNSIILVLGSVSNSTILLSLNKQKVTCLLDDQDSNTNMYFFRERWKW